MDCAVPQRCWSAEGRYFAIGLPTERRLARLKIKLDPVKSSCWHRNVRIIGSQSSQGMTKNER